MTATIPDSLRVARRSLQSVPEIVGVGDWTHWKQDGFWSLSFQIHHQGSNESIPEITSWHFRVSPAYPLGSIVALPDADAGIEATFPHQRANVYDQVGRPWRSGSICMGTHLHNYGREILTNEPWTAKSRLRWHAERAVGWVTGNADGSIVQADHPFEKPDFPSTSVYPLHFAFLENAATFRFWRDSQAILGTVEFMESTSGDGTILALKYRDGHGDLVHTTPWNERNRTFARKPYRGVWFRLPGLPVLPPYSAPTTVGELAEVIEGQGIEFWGTLRQESAKVRSGKPFVIFLGYPVKQFNRDDWSAIHWQAGLLGPLTYGKNSVKGYRPNHGPGRWINDRRTVLRDAQTIDWRPTANWSQDALTSRGVLPRAITERRFLIVGAGALGSMFAEQLARAGVTRITIVDHEPLEVGNLTRHQLTMSDLYSPKSVGMANRLNLINPNIDATSQQCRFAPTINNLDEFDVLVDTTGSDEVAYAFGHTLLNPKTAWISISVGYKAQRLYFFGFVEDGFPVDAFLDYVQPLAEEDHRQYGGDNPPLEDLGCFSPVFPARNDDMELLTACAVKEFERFMMTGQSESRVTYAQESTDGYFSGVQRYDHSV